MRNPRHLVKTMNKPLWGDHTEEISANNKETLGISTLDQAVYFILIFFPFFILGNHTLVYCFQGEKEKIIYNISVNSWVN